MDILQGISIVPCSSSEKRIVASIILRTVNKFERIILFHLMKTWL